MSIPYNTDHKRQNSSNGSASTEELTFVVAWVRAAISRPQIDPPPPIQSEQLNEAVQSLHLAHQSGGYQAAYVAWHQHVASFLQSDYSSVVKAVNNPSLLRHADDLGDTRIEWLIPGEVPANGFTVLFGASGSYKSFRALDYAEQVAQRDVVVYIAAEGTAGYSKRVKAWCQHHHRRAGKLYFWLDAVSMLDPDAVEQFVIEISALRPRLIVIDTLARCMLGGDENSAKDMGLFIHACNVLQKELNTAVMVVHHSGKNGTSERGSSALRGAADSMIEMTSDDGVIKIACSKTKDEQQFDAYYLKPVEVHLPGDESSLVLLPSERVSEDTETLSDGQQLIIEWLATNVFDEGARSADLRKATAIADTPFYRALKSLSHKGLIEKDGRFDPWILTEKGKDYARRHGLSS